MAAKIPIEILIKILNNVQSSHSTQDLYSSLLVNRTWCKVTIPILWELPLYQEYEEFERANYKKLKKKALCIRTYISCMDTQARTLLTQNGFDLSSSPPQVSFDYPSFTHKFGIDKLAYFISFYSKKFIGSDQDNNYDNDYDHVEITTESRILFREICKLIINRCSFLDNFKFEEIPKNFSKNNLNYSDLIGSVLRLPNASKVFKKLETFVSATINDKLIRPLYESLLICDNILNMDLLFTSDSHLQLLEKLVSVQKRLENLSIIYKFSFFKNGGHYKDCNSLLRNIISQKETLKSLHLSSGEFYNFELKSSPIGQFISLQELYINVCRGLHNSDCLSLASSFTQLSSFLYYEFEGYPQKFIIKILETANTNLKKICLNLYSGISSDIISAILNYCTKITELTLKRLSPEQVVEIFNNNFNELSRFSFECEHGLDVDKLLCQMAEDVPESLETIEIRMGYYNKLIFSADSLRKFFERWCCKGGGNKKIIVYRSTRFPQFTLSDEHFKVIEEYGVQFDIE